MTAIGKIALLAAVLSGGVLVWNVEHLERRPLRATALASANPLPTPPTIDVSAPPFSAICNGKTDDSAAVEMAILAACDLPSATVVIPGPVMTTTGFSTPTGYRGHLTIRGTSGASKIVLGADVNAGITFDLSAGPNGGADNVAEVDELSFDSNGHAAGAAISISYGLIASEESTAGPILAGISILGGGWTSGITLNNSWHSRIAGVYGRGSPGTGSLISFSGQSVNETIAVVQADFWRSAISATVSPNNTFQGFEIAQVNAVQCPEAFRFDGSAGIDCGAIQIANCLVDNGNDKTQVGGYFLRAVDVNDIDVANFYVVDSSAIPNPFLLTGCGSVHLVEGKVFCGNGNGPIGVSFSGCNCCEVSNVLFLGFSEDVVLDAATAWSSVHDCKIAGEDHIEAVDLGFDNKVGDSRGFTTVVELAGGKPTETVYFDVSSCSLGKKPDGVQASITSNQFYSVQYDWDDAGNTPKRVALRFFRPDGRPTDPDMPVRATIRCGP